MIRSTSSGNGEGGLPGGCRPLNPRLASLALLLHWAKVTSSRFRSSEALTGTHLLAVGLNSNSNGMVVARTSCRGLEPLISRSEVASEVAPATSRPRLVARMGVTGTDDRAAMGRDSVGRFLKLDPSVRTVNVSKVKDRVVKAFTQQT